MVGANGPTRVQLLKLIRGLLAKSQCTGGILVLSFVKVESDWLIKSTKDKKKTAGKCYIFPCFQNVA